jgi:hypothetical protein
MVTRMQARISENRRYLALLVLGLAALGVVYLVFRK